MEWRYTLSGCNLTHISSLALAAGEQSPLHHHPSPRGERGLSADHWETRGHYITGSSPGASHKKRGAVAVWQAGIGPCVSRSLLMLANVAHNHTHTHMGQVGGGMDGLTQCHDTHNLRPSAYHAPINEQSYVTLWDCKVSSVITAGIFISHQTPIFILISDTTVPPCHHFQKCHCTLTFWIIFFKAETTLSWCQCGRGGCLSGQCSSF